MRYVTTAALLALTVACANHPGSESTPTLTEQTSFVRQTEDTIFARFGVRSFVLSGLADDYSFHVALRTESGQPAGDILVQPNNEGVQYDLTDTAGGLSTFAHYTLIDGSSVTRFVSGRKDLFVEQTKEATQTRFYATDLLTKSQSILLTPNPTPTNDPDVKAWFHETGSTTAATDPGPFELMTLDNDRGFASAVSEFLSASAPALSTADMASRLRLQSADDDPICNGMLDKISTLSGPAVGFCVACPSFLTAIGVSGGSTTPVTGPGALIACPLCAGALFMSTTQLITCFVRNMMAKTNDECAIKCSQDNRGAVGTWSGKKRDCSCTCDDSLCKSASLHALGPGAVLCSAGCKGKAPDDCEPHVSVCGDRIVQNTSGCTEVCDGKGTCPIGQHCNDKCSSCIPDDVVRFCGDGLQPPMSSMPPCEVPYDAGQVVSLGELCSKSCYGWTNVGFINLRPNPTNPNARIAGCCPNSCRGVFENGDQKLCIDSNTF